MRKFVAILLALSFICAAGLAEQTAFQIEGIVRDVEGSDLLIDCGDAGYYVAHADGLEISVEAGDYVFVAYDGKATRSIPAQITASKIECFYLTGVVREITDEGILVSQYDGLGDVFVNPGEAKFDVAVDSPVKVYYDGIVALSLPGRVTAKKLDTFSLEGRVLDAGETEITVIDDAGSIVVCALLEDVSVKAGDTVKVLYNGVMTKSIPAKINALGVIVTE